MNQPIKQNKRLTTNKKVFPKVHNSQTPANNFNNLEDKKKGVRYSVAPLANIKEDSITMHISA